MMTFKIKFYMRNIWSWQRVSSTLIFIALMFVFMSNIVVAEEELSLKQLLLMPGDLTQPHVKLETKCESCHVHFDKSNQTPLCLDCHEDVANDLKRSKGFHSQLPTQQKQDCKTCHSDHKGRDFDIVALDLEGFNHLKTDFPLKGEHKDLLCHSCHREDAQKKEALPAGIIALPQAKAFRFKVFECGSCHKNIHNDLSKQTTALLNDGSSSISNLSSTSLSSSPKFEKCDSCHSEKGWAINEFDHSKTDFPLNGEHEGLGCQSCHIGQQFNYALSGECQSCHLAKEPHLGVFGKSCNDCHSEKTWENTQYQHLKETGFALKGKHNKLECIDCHGEKLNPKTQCISCHLTDDIHQGSNGEKCQSCHNEKNWDKASFDHSFAETGFIIDGGHENVKCESCHLPGLSRKELSQVNQSLNNMNMGFVKNISLVRQCVDCHRVDDPHFEKLGKDCAKCHTTLEWNQSVGFNHDFTDFPLTASHQTLVCDSCHLSADFSEQSASCVACHQFDDIHQGSLGEKCETCHDSSIWSHWQFDHLTQTDFPLSGSHKNLQCGLCHIAVETKLNEKVEQHHPDKACFSCHGDDDIHQGGFGIDCQQCHTENSFDDLSF